MRAKYVREAIPFVRSRMASEEPFPTDAGQVFSILQGAVLDIHRERAAVGDPEIPSDTDFLITFPEFWLLMDSILIVNMELQGLARELIKKHYGFEDPETAADPGATATCNRNMVCLLKSSRQFMFHERQSNGRASQLTSQQYVHPILEDFIFRAWFNQGSKSAGIQAPHRFDDGGIPLVILAFVMATLMGAVSEWLTGSFEPVSFLVRPQLTSSIRVNYHNLRSTLTSWEECLHQPDSPLTYSALRTRMLQNISDRRGAAADDPQRR